MDAGRNSDERQKWLLLIIGAEPRIEGVERLQKYGLLASRITLKGEQAYEDWESHRLGAYSRSLKSDLDLLVQRGLVVARQTDEQNGCTDYSISARGMDAVQVFKAEHATLAEKIKVITAHYSGRPLDEVLADAYSLFPEYGDKDKLINRVKNSIMKRSVSVGKEIKLPYTDRMIGLGSVTTTARVNLFPHDDEEFRRELAECAGLAGIPPTDSKAADEMSDVFADKEFLTKLTDKEIREIILNE